MQMPKQFFRELRPKRHSRKYHYIFQENTK